MHPPCSWTPFLRAVHENNYEVIQVLVEAHADINTSLSTSGDTALQIIVTSPFYRTAAERCFIMHYLIKCGLDLSARNVAGVTGDEFASRILNEPMARYLLGQMSLCKTQQRQVVSNVICVKVLVPIIMEYLLAEPTAELTADYQSYGYFVFH